MTNTTNNAKKKIQDLLQSQKLAVLATQGDGQPYTSLMAYAFTDDLRFLLVATSISTRKHANLMGESRVSMLVDNRSNSVDDFEQAAALTIVGRAKNISPDNEQAYRQIYLDRHPSLIAFLGASSTAFITIEVDKYLLVSHFEDVVEYTPDEPL